MIFRVTKRIPSVTKTIKSPTSTAAWDAYRHPAEITASLLEKEREILSIIQELHEMVGDGNNDST